MNKDHKHSKMITYFLKDNKQIDKNCNRKSTYKTEFYYNDYGSRGFIDFMAIYSDDDIICIYEMKTIIDDLGGMIRQLNRAEEVMRKRYPHMAILTYPVLHLSDENIKIIFDNIDYLEHSGLVSLFFIDAKEEITISFSVHDLKKLQKSKGKIGMPELIGYTNEKNKKEREKEKRKEEKREKEKREEEEIKKQAEEEENNQKKIKKQAEEINKKFEHTTKQTTPKKRNRFWKITGVIMILIIIIIIILNKGCVSEGTSDVDENNLVTNEFLKAYNGIKIGMDIIEFEEYMNTEHSNLHFWSTDSGHWRTIKIVKGKVNNYIKVYFNGEAKQGKYDGTKKVFYDIPTDATIYKVALYSSEEVLNISKP